MSCKVDVANSITHLDTYFLSGMWLAWLQEQIPKDMHVKEIRLHAENVLTILASIINIVGRDLYGHFTITKIFTLIMNKIFLWAPKIMRKVTMALSVNFALHLVLIVCSIS